MTKIDSSAFPRISARRGKAADLNVTFRNNGVAKDPYAIRYVEIYKSQVLPHNLVATVPVVDPANAYYPSPLKRVDSAGAALAAGVSTGAVVGEYHLLFSVPDTYTVPDVYFDVWYYFADDPCGELGTADPTGDGVVCDLDATIYDPLLLSSCHRFWIYPDEWFIDDGLQSIRFGFEPLDQKFNKPEARPLEVGIMPLPLYDYNFNLVNPIIPFLKPTISIWNMSEELIVDEAAMVIAMRHGSYRSNPYVMRYDLNTSSFYKGPYKYRATITMPDGSTRVSKSFIFTIN